MFGTTERTKSDSEKFCLDRTFARYRALFVFACLAGASASADAVVEGVWDDRVVFGQSAALEGPAKELGQNMRLGIRAAFHETNRRGGVAGRTLELVSLNDSYEPAQAVVNTRNLIVDHEVFALIGAVGTPPSRAVVPIVNEFKIPYIGPFTGAEFLRKPTQEFVFNVRASYYQETEEMVERLINDLGITRIGVLFQDDSFGRAGLRGVSRALDRRDMVVIASSPYHRNSTIVKKAILELESANPQAVIIIGSYAPAAEFIKWSRQIGFDPVFVNISFVGSVPLARELGDSGLGVYVAQVVPFPFNPKQASQYPIVQSYHRALKELDRNAEPGFVSLEGYIAGRLAIHVVESCGKRLSRTCFVEQMRKREPIDLDGFVLQYGENDNQGSDSVFFTRLGRNKTYFPVTALEQGQ